MLCILVLAAVACNKDNDDESSDGIVLVSGNISEITATSAKYSGEVISDGGSSVTERGICWSMERNPSIVGQHFVCGTETGSFAADITGLASNTTYYVRVYAVNKHETAYGSEINFTTLSGSGGGSSGGGTSNDGSYNGLDYVNLGLPSGTLWATCNVGATTPEGKGSYFAWAETTTKSSYSYANYK